jgi:hypothetical protein
MLKATIAFIVLTTTITPFPAKSVEEISETPIQTIILADELLPEIEDAVQTCDREKGKIIREKIKPLSNHSVWKGHRHVDPYSKCSKLLSILQQATYITLPDYNRNYILSIGYLDHTYAECRKAAYPGEQPQDSDGNMHWSIKLGKEPKRSHCFYEPKFVEEKDNAIKYANQWLALIDQSRYEEAFEQLEGITYFELLKRKITFDEWKVHLLNSRNKIQAGIEREHDKILYGSKENQNTQRAGGIFNYNRFTIKNKLTSPSAEKILIEVITLVEVDGVLRVESYSVR